MTLALSVEDLRERSGVRWLPGAEIDAARRRLGQWMDALGLGPIETPSRVTLARPGMTLKAYGHAHGNAPAVLLVPAPIKRAYILDLAPRASVVQECLEAGTQAYAIQWERPSLFEQSFGLYEYADRLILDCLDAVQAESGERQAFLVGHSLGGTLAAIFAALHPERVRGLVLLGAPLCFGPGIGVFGPVVATAPPSPLLTALLGNVPGSFLDMVSFAAAPVTFGPSRWLDWLASLPDSQTLQTHLRVERWTLDESPLARQLFEDVVDLLYREDRFARGSLVVGSRRVGPELVHAPILAVVSASCRVVPPESVLPFLRATQSPDTRVLWYAGDTGVALQHVGMLVGQNAHRQLWPEITRWLGGG